MELYDGICHVLSDHGVASFSVELFYIWFVPCGKSNQLNYRWYRYTTNSRSIWIVSFVLLCFGPSNERQKRHRTVSAKMSSQHCLSDRHTPSHTIGNVRCGEREINEWKCLFECTMSFSDSQVKTQRASLDSHSMQEMWTEWKRKATIEQSTTQYGSSELWRSRILLNFCGKVFLPLVEATAILCMSVPVHCLIYVRMAASINLVPWPKTKCVRRETEREREGRKCF